jgi:hypothetical protein
MRRSISIMTILICSALGPIACGSSTPDTQNGSGGSGGAAGGSGGSAGAAGGTGAAVSKPYGVFEIHYAAGETVAESYSEVTGFMYDGSPAELVIWDKKKTEGDCSLYTPRTPFCESCASGQVCVDTNTCRTPPATHDVGNVSFTGLNAPSGTSPLPLTMVSNASGTTYLGAETLPMPPCVAGAAVSMSVTGKGDYPAFSIQTQCIPPLVVTNSSFAIASGQAFNLTWTPSSVATARVQFTFDLSHHGGSKGKVICETGDTGSLTVSGTLMESLIGLGVTGYPKAYVNRIILATASVGTGQAQLKIYADRDYVAELAGLISCQNDTECPTGQTCLVPGQMCGVACTTSADCPSGQTCVSSTKACK